MEYHSLQSQASPTGFPWLQEDAHSRSATMQDWVHTFPRPRHTRVMKPRSAGNSPSTSKRRTVAQSSMHGPLPQYQSSLEAALLASAVRNPRPISWHPSSVRDRGLSNRSCIPDSAAVNYANMAAMPNQPLNALPVYGSDTMLSYPMSTEPSYSPGYYPVYSDVQDPIPLPQQTPMSMPGSQVEPMTWDITEPNADFSTVTQTPSDGWPLDMLSMTNIPPTETTCPSYASVPSPGEMSGPSTPDFLPIQHFDEESEYHDVNDGKPEEELIGMGLYNQPDGSLGQRLQGALGKGLKLEETFSPSDEDNDEGSADGSEDGEPIEPVRQQTAPDEIASLTQQSAWSIPKRSSKLALNILQKSFFFDHDDLDQQAMTAAQPYASLNQPCMSYGYGWI